MNQAPFLSPCIFLFNYSQPVQVLLYFPSPYAALPSCFFFFFFSIPNCAFGLSPIPFSWARAPCSAQICWLCNLRCAHMLPLPRPPLLLLLRLGVPRASQGSKQAENNSTMAAAGSSALDGGPRAAPLAQLIGGAARPALQLLSNWALLLCRRDGWQGSHFPTSWPARLSSQPS